MEWYTGAMSTTAEPEHMEAWEAVIRTVGSLLKTFEGELQDAVGLPLPWYDVLIQLSAATDGRLRMQALAESVVLSRSGLTRLIDRMVKADLVEREHCAEDRRGYYAVLTEEGRRAFLVAKPIHERGIHEHFTRHLDQDDARALLAAFTKVRKGNRL